MELSRAAFARPTPFTTATAPKLKIEASKTTGAITVVPLSSAGTTKRALPYIAE